MGLAGRHDAAASIEAARPGVCSRRQVHTGPDDRHTVRATEATVRPFSERI